MELEFRAEDLQIWLWIFGVGMFGVRGSRGCGKDIWANSGVCTLPGWECRPGRDLWGGRVLLGTGGLVPHTFSVPVISQLSEDHAGPPLTSLSWLGLSSLTLCPCLFQDLCVHLQLSQNLSLCLCDSFSRSMSLPLWVQLLRLSLRISVPISAFPYLSQHLSVSLSLPLSVSQYLSVSVSPSVSISVSPSLVSAQIKPGT